MAGTNHRRPFVLHQCAHTHCRGHIRVTDGRAGQIKKGTVETVPFLQRTPSLGFASLLLNHCRHGEVDASAFGGTDTKNFGGELAGFACP